MIFSGTFGSSDNLAANSLEANTSAIIHSAAVHLYQLSRHRKMFVIRRPWDREKWLDADSGRQFLKYLLFVPSIRFLLSQHSKLSEGQSSPTSRTGAE